jgi:hypothetical protein
MNRSEKRAAYMRIYNKSYRESEHGRMVRKRSRQSEGGLVGRKPRDKRFRESKLGRIAKAKAQIIYRRKYPQKLAAYNATQRAIRNGKLIRQPCMICGNPRSQAHHPNYAQKLAVEWLCETHHKNLHRFELKK